MPIYYGVIGVVEELKNASRVSVCEWRVAVAEGDVVYHGVVSGGVVQLQPVEVGVGRVYSLSWSPGCEFLAVGGERGVAVVDVNANAVLSVYGVEGPALVAWGDALYSVTPSLLLVFESPPVLQPRVEEHGLDRVFWVARDGRLVGLRDGKLVVVEGGAVKVVYGRRVDAAVEADGRIAVVGGREVMLVSGGRVEWRRRLGRRPTVLRYTGGLVALGFETGDIIVYNLNGDLEGSGVVEGRVEDLEARGDELLVAAGKLYLLARGRGEHPRRKTLLGVIEVIREFSMP